MPDEDKTFSGSVVLDCTHSIGEFGKALCIVKRKAKKFVITIREKLNSVTINSRIN